MKRRNGLERVLDVVLAARHRRTSKRNKGFPNQSVGPASGCRRLTGAELEARAQELGAAASKPREVSHQQQIAPVGQHGPAKPPRIDFVLPRSSWSSYARWQRLRLKGQARFFDMDRPEAIR